jgi:hypothetical protein
VEPRLDCAEVRERTAEPAVVHKRQLSASRLYLDCLTSLFLCADYQQLSATGHDVTNEVECLIKAGNRLLQINDVDAVALGEYELAHLRIPSPSLMPEMDPGFEELLHADWGNQSEPPLNDA